ncbi:DNA-binding protein [Salinimonas sediminis]|uniref:DNA-binding protein n=2 Tax=Salinimonas sediminis TaxID=2303538 RepID=A0A346NMI0_9ALTE|nr:DNA-binding protein [Salinimonas sediminis]
MVQYVSRQLFIKGGSHKGAINHDYRLFIFPYFDFECFKHYTVYTYYVIQYIIMARTGVTLTNVKQATEAIIARGNSVSIDAVRAELGNTGSKSTIHKHLKRLTEGGANAPVEVLLSEELQQLVSHVAARLKKETHATLVERESRFKKSLDEQAACAVALSEQNDTLQAQIARANNDIAELTQYVTDITAARDTALRECDRYEQRLASMTQEIQLLTTHNQSLEDKHVDARAALEHYRASVASQRERETHHFESTIAQLNHQQHALTQELAGLTGTNQEQKLTLARLEVTLSQALNDHKALADQNRFLEEALAQSRSNNQRLEQTVERLEHASDLLRDDLSSSTDALNTQTIALNETRQQLVAADATVNTQAHLTAEYMHQTNKTVKKTKKLSVNDDTPQ